MQYINSVLILFDKSFIIFSFSYFLFLSAFSHRLPPWRQAAEKERVKKKWSASFHIFSHFLHHLLPFHTRTKKTRGHTHTSTTKKNLIFFSAQQNVITFIQRIFVVGPHKHGTPLYINSIYCLWAFDGFYETRFAYVMSTFAQWWTAKTEKKQGRTEWFWLHYSLGCNELF